MNEKTIAADWGSVKSWAPIFKQRKQTEKEIADLEAEILKAQNAPLSREDVKERLKNAEVEKVVEAMAIRCAQGEDLEFLTDRRRAVEIFCMSSLMTAARKAVDKIPDADWPENSLSEIQKTTRIKNLQSQIKKKRDALDLGKIEDKSLLIFNDKGVPIAFRPDNWVTQLSTEIRKTGAAFDDAGNARYGKEKLEAIKILSHYLP